MTQKNNSKNRPISVIFECLSNLVGGSECFVIIIYVVVTNNYFKYNTDDAFIM